MFSFLAIISSFQKCDIDGTHFYATIKGKKCHWRNTQLGCILVTHTKWMDLCLVESLEPLVQYASATMDSKHNSLSLWEIWKHTRTCLKIYLFENLENWGQPSERQTGLTTRSSLKTSGPKSTMLYKLVENLHKSESLEFWTHWPKNWDVEPYSFQVEIYSVDFVMEWLFKPVFGSIF